MPNLALSHSWSMKPPAATRMALGHPLAPNVAAWLLNEGAGKTAYDTSERNNPLTVNATWGRGGIRLNGTSEYMTAPAITLGLFTVIARFSATADGLVYEHSTNANSGNGSYLYTSTGNTADVNRSSNNVAANLTASWGRFANLTTVAFTFNGTAASQTLYVNGTAQALTIAGTDPGSGTTTQPFYVGSRAGSGVFLAGQLDFLYLYNRALSAAAIQTITLNPFQMYVPSPSVFYSFPSGVTFLPAWHGANRLIDASTSVN